MLIIILICFLISNSDAKLSLKSKNQLKLLRERFDLTNELEIKPSAKSVFDQNWVNKTSDPFLYNWLEFNKFDLDLTETNLKKSLDWRRLNNIDKVLDWNPPAEFLKDFPIMLTGHSKDGDPVYFANIGLWDGRTALRSGKRRELFKYVIYVVERVIRGLEEKNNEIRRNNSLEEAGNFIMLGNVEGVKLAQVLSINVLGFVASALGALQANYPFLHKVGIAVNAPGIVKTVVDVAKSVLTSETFDRLFVYSESDTEWKTQIFEYAPKEAIPIFMGGEAIV